MIYVHQKVLHQNAKKIACLKIKGFSMLRNRLGRIIGTTSKSDGLAWYQPVLVHKCFQRKKISPANIVHCGMSASTAKIGVLVSRSEFSFYPWQLETWKFFTFNPGWTKTFFLLLLLLSFSDTMNRSYM